MNNINKNAKAVLESLKNHEDIEVTFETDEITIYWENLRMKVEPKDFENALFIIKSLKEMGAYFE